MAKKGQVLQLQQELNSDDDWNKLLQKDGLIVVDIYSEWCGPCTAMVANLKKLKLEGGDNLQLAMAKSDNISYLERFRNQSEPTWMFIAGGKMINLMFGANAPKLTKLIKQGLASEAEIKKGKQERSGRDISELSDEEAVRYKALKQEEEEAIRLETEKKEKDIREKRVAAAKHVLANTQPFGVIVVFPQAKQQAQSTLSDRWNPAGLSLAATEKVPLTPEKVEELLYFTENEFSNGDVESFTEGPGLAYLIKPAHNDDSISDIDSSVLELVYGSSQCPPGSPDSPAQRLTSHLTKTELQVKITGNTKLLHKVGHRKGAEVEQKEEASEYAGLWAPPNSYSRAIAIKLLFPKIYDPIAKPEPPPVPPHVAVAYEVFKRKEVLDLVEQFREDVIRYGFFSCDNPEAATLLAKTLPLFEKAYSTAINYNERLFVQVSKNRKEPLQAFLDLGPTFVSKNYVEGEVHCKMLFPPDYDVKEGKKGVAEVKKKKRRGKRGKVHHEALVEGEHVEEPGAVEEEAEGEHAEGEGEAEGESDGEGEGEAEAEGDENAAQEEDSDAVPGEADKATSPMPDD